MQPRPLLAVLALALGTAPLCAQEADLLATGKTLFSENCVECHGKDGSEGSGGDIRGSDLRTVKKMTKGGVEDMPEFEFTQEELEAIVAYLASL